MKQYQLNIGMCLGLLVSGVVFSDSASPAPITGEMISDSYKITTSVVSGGGSAMDSTSYSNIGTTGQATPLTMSSDTGLSSDLFIMHPGFWNTVSDNQTAPVALPWLILLISD